MVPKSYGQGRWILPDNLELIRYYGDRKVWLVEPDAIPARITPYPMPESVASATH